MNVPRPVGFGGSRWRLESPVWLRKRPIAAGFCRLSVRWAKLDGVLGDQRRRRDARALQLFVASPTYREIARFVGLRSPSSIGDVIRRQLEAAAEELDAEELRRELLRDQAAAVLVERREALWRAHFPRAIAGDYKSSVICVRLLDVQQRAIPTGRAGRLSVG